MKKGILYFLMAFVICFFVLPNLFSSREKTEFLPEIRIESTRRDFPNAASTDSIQTEISSFYSRGSIMKTLFGEEYRDLWNTEVWFPVWHPDKINGGMQLGEAGGGQQTVSLDVIDSSGQIYSLRSVQKDQSRALPSWLFYSLARPVFRDQASSINPFAAPVVARLAKYAGIPHMNPVLYFIPYYNGFTTEQNKHIAGRVMLMEEEPDESWNYSDRFGTTSVLLDTDDMLEYRREGEFWVDTLLFAKCRIFDVLIGDWDRHEKQWAWSCDTVMRRCIPLPIDRDMAFYDFRGGVVDALAGQIVPKFQSYEKAITNLNGYLQNGAELHEELLFNLTKSQWEKVASEIKFSLDSENITEAFQQYPPEVVGKYGPEHRDILMTRLEKVDSIAQFFYSSMH